MVPLSARRLPSLGRFPHMAPASPGLVFERALQGSVSAGSAAGSGFPQCTGRWGPEVTELRLRRPSPEGLRAAEGRGVQGAGRYRAGPEPQLWSLSLAAAPFLRAAPGLRSRASRPRRPVHLAL